MNIYLVRFGFFSFLLSLFCCRCCCYSGFFFDGGALVYFHFIDQLFCFARLLATIMLMLTAKFSTLCACVETKNKQILEITSVVSANESESEFSHFKPKRIHSRHESLRQSSVPVNVYLELDISSLIHPCTF